MVKGLLSNKRFGVHSSYESICGVFEKETFSTYHDIG